MEVLLLIKPRAKSLPACEDGWGWWWQQSDSSWQCPTVWCPSWSPWPWTRSPPPCSLYPCNKKCYVPQLYVDCSNVATWVANRLCDINCTVYTVQLFLSNSLFPCAFQQSKRMLGSSLGVLGTPWGQMSFRMTLFLISSANNPNPLFYLIWEKSWRMAVWASSRAAAASPPTPTSQHCLVSRNQIWVNARQDINLI